MEFVDKLFIRVIDGSGYSLTLVARYQQAALMMVFKYDLTHSHMYTPSVEYRSLFIFLSKPVDGADIINL